MPKRISIWVGKTKAANGEEKVKIRSDKAAALLLGWTKGLTISGFLKLIQKSDVMPVFTNS